MNQNHPTLVYKVCNAAEWQAAGAAGAYKGSHIDCQDGFIHFSTAQQLRETVRRYFAEMRDLVLVEVNGSALGAALKWEPSRGGELFPHLYGDLALAAVAQVWDLPLGEDGAHQFPAQLEQSDA